MIAVLLSALALLLGPVSTGRVCLESDAEDGSFCSRWIETPGDARYTSVAVNDAICAVRRDRHANARGGVVECWGGPHELERGVPAREFLAVDVGREHACGLTAEHTVVCWGTGVAATVPELVAADKFQAITAGDYHSCAMAQDDGSAICWGENSMGQLVIPTSSSYENVEVVNPAARTPADVSAAAGSEWRTTSMEHQPEEHGNPAYLFKTPGDDGYDEWRTRTIRLRAIDAGAYHTCGIRLDYTVTCWGDASANQLQVPADLYATSLSAGGFHSCAIDTPDARVQASLETILTKEQALADAEAIVAAQKALDSFKAARAAKAEAARQHNDPIRKNTTRILCWGEDSKSRLQPPPAPLGPSPRHAFGGLLPFCATNPSNGYCGGNKDFVVKGNVADFRAVTVGSGHSCLLLGDDDGDGDHTPSGYEDRGYELPRSRGSTALCWGDDTFGQALTPPPAEDRMFRGGWLFLSVAAGEDTTCGIAHDERLYCWGRWLPGADRWGDAWLDAPLVATARQAMPFASRRP